VKNFGFRALAPIALATMLLPASRASILLIDQVTPYSGYGYGLSSWTGMTSALNSAFGSANITLNASPLSSLAYLMGFNALWITARQPGDPGLSASEISNVQAFIATGRRVVLTGENNSWTAWNNSILSVVGGSYSGIDTSATLTPAIGGPLTAGVSDLATIVDGVATGGTPVFSQNVITLWGGAQNSVSMLSVNIVDDTYGVAAGNQQFKVDLANWLAGQSGDVVPEPSTYLMLAGGLALVAAARRLRGA
jgi:hypothetical protein